MYRIETIIKFAVEYVWMIWRMNDVLNIFEEAENKNGHQKY